MLLYSEWYNLLVNLLQYPISVLLDISFSLRVQNSTLAISLESYEIEFEAEIPH